MERFVGGQNRSIRHRLVEQCRNILWGATGIVSFAMASVSTASADVIYDTGSNTGWVIESADYTGQISDHIVRLEAHYVIRVVRNGSVEIPLALQGAAVTAIEIEKKTSEARIIPRANSYVLTASRKGTYKVRVAASSLLTEDVQSEGLTLRIPQATFSTFTLLVPRKDVELRQQDQLYVEREREPSRQGVKLVAHLGAADRVDLRWKTKPTQPEKVEPVLYGDVLTTLAVEEQLARIISVIDYRIIQGETATLLVRLPSEMNVVNVRGAGITDWHLADSEGGKQLTVSLAGPLRETSYRLMIEGEQALSDASAECRLPEVQLIGVKQERGYVAVSRSGSIELSLGTAENIQRIDVKELPDVLRAAAGAPVTLAFTYHQHPYRATLALIRHEDHPVLSAVAERGELTTVISRQGEVLTRASYLIHANKKQFLEVRLPQEATLWSCVVQGRSVKPVKGMEDALLVPLDAVIDPAETVAVELVYFGQRPVLERFGHLALRGPILDIPTTLSNWSVYAPRDVKFLRMKGNLERGAVAAEFVDDPLEQASLASSNDRTYKDEQNMGFLDVSTAGRLLASRVKHAAKRREAGSESPKPEQQLFDKDAIDSQNVPAGGAGQVGNAFEEKEEAISQRGNWKGETLEGLPASLQQSGILPLKIRLPKSGTVYRFSRLMTTQEALTLDATFVHLPVRLPPSWVTFAAFGLLVTPAAGLFRMLIRRS